MAKKRVTRKSFCFSLAQLDTDNIELLIAVQQEICYVILDELIKKGKQGCLLADKMVEKNKITQKDIDDKVKKWK